MLGTPRGNARDCAAISFLALASRKAWNDHLISLALSAPARAHQPNTTQTQSQPTAAGDGFFSDLPKKPCSPSVMILPEGGMLYPSKCGPHYAAISRGTMTRDTNYFRPFLLLWLARFAWRSFAGVAWANASPNLMYGGQ